MPAPLWPQTGDPTVENNRVRFRTPALLRFATDTFMEDFLTLLNTQPERLSEFVAAPEQWDKPPGEPAPPVTKSGMMLTLFRARSAAVKRLQAKGVRIIGESSSPAIAAAKQGLKLYQPAHQRFYLVTACLVCRVLGLPDRKIDAGAQERATFVIRMLQPTPNADLTNPDPRDCTELALVNGAWQQAADPETLMDGEEQRPLFPAAFQQDDARRRRLLAGLVPVGDRERLLQAAHAPSGSSADSGKVIDARQMLLKTRVIGPMKTMEDIATAAYTLATTPAPDPSKGLSDQDKNAIVNRANDELQLISWYVLLDLAKFFEANLDELWQEIKNQGDGKNLSSPELKAIWNTLSQTTFSSTTLLSAVWRAYGAASMLDTVVTPYSTITAGGTNGWPGFKFRFYTASLTGTQQLSPPLDRKAFEELIVQALPKQNPHPPLPVRAIAQAHANSQVPAWFTIRCVLERPNCGSLTPPLLSEPTVPFQMAAFFDPDAPARPIRIGMPVDTTPAGLRKFDKNTAFVMSDTLCGQVGKMGGKGLIDLIMSVLPFPLHKDLDGGSSPCTGGMVCSFSIPIITICALILLIIFVKLLDIVFFWMPFFQICLPLPNFTAKASES